MLNKTNDDIFAEEFQTMMNMRKNSGGATLKRYAISNIEVPNYPTLLPIKKSGHYARIDKIEEEYFDKLNKSFVEIYPSRSYAKRIVMSDGSFKKNDKGLNELKTVTIDANSYLVKSPINLKISNYVKDENNNFKLNARGEKIRYSYPEGFDYLDYEDIDKTRYFIYSVPKQYVFKTNMRALILSVHKHISTYCGYRVAMQNGCYYYLSVIDFKRTQFDNTTRVLGITDKTDLSAEMRATIDFWVKKQYMFDLGVTSLPYKETAARAPDNLGCMYFIGKLIDEQQDDENGDTFSIEEDI